MDLIHTLARKHLIKNDCISGMPERSSSLGFRELSLNLNHFSDSSYVSYSLDANEKLSQLFLDYLCLEAMWKGCFDSRASLLNPLNTLFVSSSHAIDLLIRVFCEPAKDAICIATPSFPLYQFCAHNHHVKVIDVPLQGVNLDTLSIQKIIETKAKILFLPIPNNPVGTIVKRQDLLDLLSLYEGIVVIDEAYSEFSDELSYVEEMASFPNLVVLRSFSKIWGHAGIRSGVVISSEVIIKTLIRILPPCFFPSQTQEILEHLLSHPEIIYQIRALAISEREKLGAAFKSMSSIKHVYPSQTNFYLVIVDDAEKLYHKCLEGKILIKKLHPFIYQGLRISLGTCQDNAEIMRILN